jgi:hypothetical protein
VRTAETWASSVELTDCPSAQAAGSVIDWYEALSVLSCVRTSFRAFWRAVSTASFCWMRACGRCSIVISALMIEAVSRPDARPLMLWLATLTVMRHPRPRAPDR